MLFIYGTINFIFEDLLSHYGFMLIKPIKSNIHPSVLYRSVKRNCELQVGYNYEEDVPFANIYGVKMNVPIYQNTLVNISPKKKLILYSSTIKEFLQINSQEFTDFE